MTESRNFSATSDVAVMLTDDLTSLNPAPPLRFSKLLFDKVFSGCTLVLLAPVFAFIAAAIWITSGGPVVFAHTRIGRNGRPFHCLKFRTMSNDAATRLRLVLRDDPKARQEWEAHHKLTNDPRITRLGRFLRQSSLDELPQFWNVLWGDMSIVGPRPISESELVRYAEHLASYTSVRPGITGLWQVSGRSNIDYDERVLMDVEYVRNWGFWRDVSIVWRTLGVVLAAKGAQ